MAPILRTDDLTKDYGHVLGLDGLTLDVDEGEALGFLGPNGSGKTTTIRLLLDLLRPTRGTATIGGFDCHRQSLDARRLVGYLPGEMPVCPELTGAAYLDLLTFVADAWPTAAPLRPYSPFHYFPGFAVANGTAPVAHDLGVLATLTVVLGAIAYWQFSRRDL